MLVLGIETSCDEIGLALFDSNQGLIGNKLYSQMDLHAAFGGVMPEQASRDHVIKMIPLLQKLFETSQCSLSDIHGIAYTQGPGLIGSLLVGAMLGRTLAFALNIPAIGIHHLEGHLLAPFIENNNPQFPFLALLVSGGHTELIAVHDFGDYEILGETLDDAAGEAFDKTARLLGLPYPGGAALAKLAESGVKNRFHFPRPMVGRPGLDFSFSGLKTFAYNTIQSQGVDLDLQTKADIAYAFQEAVVETLTLKCKRALKTTGFKRLIIAGGVGANLALRRSLTGLAKKENFECYFPPVAWCTDNGAMIAYAGCQRLLAKEFVDLSVTVLPRWPLDELKK